MRGNLKLHRCCSPRILLLHMHRRVSIVPFLPMFSMETIQRIVRQHSTRTTTSYLQYSRFCSILKRNRFQSNQSTPGAPTSIMKYISIWHIVVTQGSLAVFHCNRRHCEQMYADHSAEADIGDCEWSIHWMDLLCETHNFSKHAQVNCCL